MTKTPTKDDPRDLNTILLAQLGRIIREAEKAKKVWDQLVQSAPVKESEANEDRP